MINRERYMQMRKSGQLDLSFFFQYFKEIGGKLTFHEFQIVFMNQEYMNMAIRHFDVGFTVCLLYNKKNQLINVY